LFRRALKHAALAAALLVPTIAAVGVQAPAAHAATQQLTYNGWNEGDTYVAINHHDTATGCNKSWTDYYSFTATPYGAANPNWDPSSEASSVNFHFAPGEHLTAYFDALINTPSGCTANQATEMYAKIMQPQGYPSPYSGGNDPGYVTDNNWDQTFTGCVAGTKCEYTHDMWLDPATFSGTQTSPLKGMYEMYFNLEAGGDEAGLDSVGDCYPGPCSTSTDTVTGVFSNGIFETGYNASMVDTSSTRISQDVTAAGKGMAYDRVYGGWGLPNSAESGRVANDSLTQSVFWSVNFSVDSPLPSGFVVESGKSVLRSIADGYDDTLSNGTGLIAQIDQLATDAEQTGLTAGFTLWHEPAGGGGSGSRAIGHVGAYGSVGSSQDLRDAYQHLYNLVYGLNGHSTAEGQGWVKVVYIETNWAMNKNGTRGSTGCPEDVGQTGVAGGGDPNRPCDSAYDTLGVDMYNYYQMAHWSGTTVCPASGTACDAWRDAGYSSFLGSTTDSASTLAVAAKHQKHIVITELGSHPGCPGGRNGAPSGDKEDANCPSSGTLTTRDTWFQNFYNTLTGTSAQSVQWQHWIIGFMYYNEIHNHDMEVINRTATTYNAETSAVCTARSWTATSPCWTGNYGASSTQDLEDYAGWGYFSGVNTSATHADWFVDQTTATAPLVF